MVWVLLPLWLAAAQQSETSATAAASPQQLPTAAAQQVEKPETPDPAPLIINKMQASLDKQRAAVRKQAADWISVGDSPSNNDFVIPFPKPPATAATNIAFAFPCEPMPESELEQIVQSSAAKQKVSPKLVRAMIMQESGGRPCAVSNKGAEGLMQLMPEVQRELSVANPFDPAQSVEGGVRLLRQLLDRYAGDVPRALAAYNAGAGAVDRAGGIPPIPETTNYVNQIVKRAHIE